MNNTRQHLIPFALVILLSAAMLSCSASVPIPPGLANKGILPLSSSDPYFGSNTFLSTEMEQSTYLHNFIKTEGGPAAIELVQETFGETRLIMYYPRRDQTYVAVPQVKAEQRQWIVRGPYPIEREDFRRLKTVQAGIKAAPPFMVWGRLYRFTPEVEQKPAQTLTPILLPTPTPKPRVVRKVEPPSVKEEPSPSPDGKASPFTPLNTDQQALMISEGYAERTPAGDIVHVVKAESETLELLAKWYTGAAKNAQQLKTTLKVELTAGLPVGTIVQVPIELVQRTKTLPPDFK